MSDETPSLRSCFADAEAQRRKLDNAYDSNRPDFQELLGLAISKYEECVKIATQVSIFSPNETLEDVGSGDLQFFVIHYYIAELTMRRTRGEREQILLKAREELDKFLKLTDSYDMLAKGDVKLYERYMEDKLRFSTASVTDAGARRQTKIARLKGEQALKQKLEHLRRNPTALESSDESLRTLHLTHVALCIHLTFQSLESIGLELQMLARAPPLESPRANPVLDQRARPDVKDTYSERLDGPLSGLATNSKAGPILTKDGRPIRPFTLLDSRQRLRDGVFRPDYNLPTMTIDEYLEEEKKRGGFIEGGGEQSGRKEVVDEDDMEAADQQTMKARYWDEFKEENPRGSGNTMNMG